MENNTNMNESIPSEYFKIHSIIPLGFLILVYSFSISVLWRCKKLVKTIRFWFQFVLVSNLVAFGSYLISRLPVAGGLIQSLLYYRIFDAIARTGFHSGFIGTFALGCEQLGSFVFAMTYQRYTTTLRLWICGILTFLLSFIASLTVFFGEIEFGHMDTTRVASWTTCLLRLIFSGLITIVYAVIGFIARSKHTESNAELSSHNNEYSRFLKVTTKSFILAIAYGVFVLPLSIADIVCLMDESCLEWVENLILAKDIMTVLFRFNLPIILVTSCYESRYVTMATMCRCQKAYIQRLEIAYKQQYATFELATISRHAPMSREEHEKEETELWDRHVYTT